MILRILLILFIKSHLLFAGGSSGGKTTEWRRDQFIPQASLLKQGGSTSYDESFHVKFAECQDGGNNFCNNNEKNISCCIGNNDYNQSTLVQYLGQDTNGHRLGISFIVSDSDEGVATKTFIIRPNETKQIRVNGSFAPTISAKIENFEYDKPGFDQDFDLNKGINELKLYSNNECGCSNKKNIIHCAGYVFTGDALEDNCKNTFKKYTKNCIDVKECQCDNDCMNNNYLPRNFDTLNLGKQSCYLCNKIGYIAEKNCLLTKNCLHQDIKNAFNYNKNIVKLYGPGYYGCIYFDNKRAGCVSFGNESIIRHYPKIIKNTSDKLNPNYKFNPGINLFLDLPYIRKFYDKDIAIQEQYGCNKYISAEIGSKHRGTHFGPIATIVFGATEVKTEFAFDRNIMINQVDRIYGLDLSNNSNFIKYTRFNNDIIKIQKTIEFYDGKNCSKKTLNQTIDVVTRLEYNIITGESEMVGYQINESSSNDNDDFDPVLGTIRRQKIRIVKDSFISDTVYYRNNNNKRTTTFNSYGKDFTITRIGSVPRPVIRHFYDNTNKILHPVNIQPFQYGGAGQSSEYYNFFQISISPKLSVNPLESTKDKDYNLPTKAGNVSLSKQDSILSVIKKQNPPAKHTYIYGERYSINNDPCTALLFIKNIDYLTNPRNIEQCYTLSNENSKNECITAAMLVPYCNSQTFCREGETKEECSRRKQIKIYSDNNSLYRYNKDFQNNLFTCIYNIEVPNELNTLRYGPYGNKKFDHVVSFIRDKADKASLTTRPLTNINPNDNEKYKYEDIFVLNDSYFQDYDKKKLINYITKNNNWIFNFTKSNTVEDLMQKIEIRSKTPDEMPDNTLCTKILYYSKNSWDFYLSKRNTDSDYDVYIPLRCQFLNFEAYGAGGAGMTEPKGYLCRSSGYSTNLHKHELPKVASSGCGGGYISGVINYDNIKDYDYLGIQVGERTIHKQIEMSTIDTKFGKCEPNAAWHNETGKYIGGYHPDNRGDSKISILKDINGISYQSIAKAKKGGSQISALESRDIDKINVLHFGVIHTDAGIAAGLTIAEAVCLMTLYIPCLFTSGLFLNLIPLLALTYGIKDQHLSEDCRGSYEYDSAFILSPSYQKGSLAKMSTGTGKPLGAKVNVNFICDQFKSNASCSEETISNGIDEMVTQSEDISSIKNSGFVDDAVYRNYKSNFIKTELDMNLEPNYNKKIDVYYQIKCNLQNLNNCIKKVVKKKTCYTYDPSGTCTNGMFKDKRGYCTYCKCDTCSKYSTENPLVCLNCSYDCNTFITYDPLTQCSSMSSELQIGNNAYSAQDIKDAKFQLSSTYVYASNGSFSGGGLVNEMTKYTDFQNYSSSDYHNFNLSAVSNINNPFFGEGGAFNDGWEADQNNSGSNKKYSYGGGSGKVRISSPSIQYKDLSVDDPVPITLNGKKQLAIGPNAMPDKDCQIRCPRINVLFKNIRIRVEEKTKFANLICEYLGSPSMDMEVGTSSNLIYPGKCYIVGSDLNDALVEKYHGAIITRNRYCPVAKCIEGIYNQESRLYGLCKYKDISNQNTYENAIFSNNNIFSGSSYFGYEYQSKNVINGINYDLSTCIDIENNQIIVLNDEDTTLDNNLIGLKCTGSGFWEYPVKTNLMTTTQKQNIAEKCYSRDNSKNQISCIDSPDQGNVKDYNDAIIESHYIESSISTRRVFNNMIFCNPISQGIDWDFEYSGNASWKEISELKDQTGTCFTNDAKNKYIKIQNLNPTRQCKKNGLWSAVKNPCGKICENISEMINGNKVEWSININNNDSYEYTVYRNCNNSSNKIYKKCNLYNGKWEKTVIPENC